MRLEECLEISSNWKEKVSNVFSVFADSGQQSLKEVRNRYEEIFGTRISETSARNYIDNLRCCGFIGEVNVSINGKITYGIYSSVDENFINIVKNKIKK